MFYKYNFIEMSLVFPKQMHKMGWRKADHSNCTLILGTEYHSFQLKELKMIICIKDVSLLNHTKPLLSYSEDKHLLG